MAITYHAGRRIQGTSTDAIPLYRGETPVIDGSDTVITFLQDGKFTPTSSFDVEYLVVGGGGGSTTGGGGAGGYLANNSKNHGVTAQDYNISVGAGGTCTSLAVGNGKGGDSSFDTITATGGGSGGGSDGNQTGVNGGSGGGGHSGWNPPATTGGAGNTPSTTPSQGNNGSGGAGSTWSYAYGGAGGGSASAGSGAQPRVGGSGTQNDITGTNTYYAAGGGGASWFTAGGAGGTGGGGNAGDEDDGVGQDGQTYGSGGGASFVESGKASGKQGIVVIRFATSGNTYETSLGGRPTNVQVGSRYEETDTRKMYNSTPTSVDTEDVYDEITGRTDVSVFITKESPNWSNGEGRYLGLEINDNAGGQALVGKGVKKIKVRLYRGTALTGTYRVGIMDSSGTVKGYSDHDASEVTGSSATYSHTMNNAVILAVGDIIFISYTATTNPLYLRTNNITNGFGSNYSGAFSPRSVTTGTTWVTSLDGDASRLWMMDFDFAPATDQSVPLTWQEIGT